MMHHARLANSGVKARLKGLNASRVYVVKLDMQRFGSPLRIEKQRVLKLDSRQVRSHGWPCCWRAVIFKIAVYRMYF